MKKFRGLIVDEIKDANVIFVGVPYDCNASINSGSRFAPNKIRELSYWLPPYTMNGHPMKNVKIFDSGDYLINDFQDLFSKAKELMEIDNLKFIVGGDHSISIPFQKEFVSKCQSNNKTPVIIHIDAHCDICIEYHGSKFSHACTVRRALENGLEQENLFMIGIREFEIDGYEYLIKNENKVNLFLATEILENGLDVLFGKLSKVNNNKYKIYVSFDIDSLDAAYVPGTGTPETCGLTPNHLRKILNYLGTFKNIEAIDLVEIAPSLDSNDITSWCGIKLMYEFLNSYFNDNV